VELLVFLPLVLLKAVVMGSFLWWALRNRGNDDNDEGEDGDGGLRVDVVVGPRSPPRWVRGPRSPHGPHASPSRRPRRRTPVR
jgi:nitrogen fixation-related uncharacterized protein